MRAESELWEGSVESTKWGKRFICIAEDRKGDKFLHYLCSPRLSFKVQSN